MLKSEPVEDKAQDMDASAKLISGGVLVGLKAEASYVSACGSEAHPCDEQVSPGVRTQAGVCLLRYISCICLPLRITCSLYFMHEFPWRLSWPYVGNLDGA